MKKLMFAVYDKQTFVFANPFISINENAAIRDFAHAIRDPGSNIAIYAEDTVLYKIADYDDATGQLSACEPLKVATGLQFLDPNHQ